MDVDKRRALSSFYREEFLRHISHLQTAGIIDDGKREATERAFVTRLDQLCLLRGFPAVAETVLQRFDALSGLSNLESRLSH